MAPIQRRRAKPPNICLQNFTHSGVVFGGDNEFGPSRARTSCAFLSVKPLKKRISTFILILNKYLIYFTNVGSVSYR
jgi:hypothetical protein